MSELEISVIVPTYNRLDFLVNTVKSLLNQDFERYEVIIVDNSPQAGAKDTVESIRGENSRCLIIYLWEPKPGLHNARHTGAKEARGDILLYIDDDVIADPHLLREIRKCYNSPEIGCVGGRILPKWEVAPPEWVKLFPNWYLSLLDDEDGPRPVQWIYGCNFSIKRDLLFSVGGFHPDAFGDRKLWWYRGDGEIGLLRKVHNRGKKVIYNPGALVWHYIPRSRLTLEYFKERAFKSGIEASFAKYRYGDRQINPVTLAVRSLVFGAYSLAHSLIGTLPFQRRIKYQVNAANYRARCLYEARLILDRKLREFVREGNWAI